MVRIIGNYAWCYEFRSDMIAADSRGGKNTDVSHSDGLQRVAGIETEYSAGHPLRGASGCASGACGGLWMTNVLDLQGDMGFQCLSRSSSIKTHFTRFVLGFIKGEVPSYVPACVGSSSSERHRSGCQLAGVR